MSKKNLTITIMAIILFVILAIAIEADYLTRFESWVYSESIEHMSPNLTTILIIITNIGGPIGVAAISLIIFLVPKLRNKIAIPVSITICSSFAIDVILKNIFARERPNILRFISETSYSFPSGHAMVNMALYSMRIIYAYKLIKKSEIKWGAIAFMTVLVVLIGFTRIYLGVHYAGDIIGGWLLGFAVTMIVYMAMKKTTINEDNKEMV